MSSSYKRVLGVSDDPTALRPTLADCLETVLQRSGTLVDRMLEGLIPGPGQSKTLRVGGEVPGAVKAAIDRLLGERLALKVLFAERLRKGMFGGVVQDITPQALLRFEDLQLLDENQLDENIELARAQQDVSLAVDDVLPALDARMSTMLGWITIQPHLNPLRPDVFVRAARDMLASEIDDPQVREALLGPVAGRMGVELRRIYVETTSWLASFGIEAAGLPAPSASGDAPATGQNGSAVAKTLLTLDRLRKLLSGELDNPALASARSVPNEFLHTIPASIEALQDMQQVEAMVQRLAQKARADASNPASRRPPPASRRQLGIQLGEEVAHMMLENLIHDHRLLPGVKDLVASMKPMLLEMARSDSLFFSDRQHPARRFLDRVIHRSLAYTSERDEGYARFLKSVTAALAVVRGRSIEGLAAALGELLKKLELVWERDDERLRQSQEQAAKALMHAEQRNMLAQRHAQDFREKLATIEAPAVVSDFLAGPWAQAVAESQLRGTDGHTDPHGYLELVDDLLWSVQSSVARRNRQRLVQMIPGLLGRLRQGLQLIGYPPERITAFFDALIAVHEAALEGGRARAGEGQPEDATDGGPDSLWLRDPELPGAGLLTGETDASAAAVAASAQLKPGAWAELMLEGSWVRAQLNWVSPHKTMFMFSLASGVTHSLSSRALQQLVEQGRLRVVSNGHMVDGALDAVAQAALRNSLKPGEAQGDGSES